MSHGPPRWIFAPRQTEPDVHLFCFPHAGSGASTYAGWQSALGSRTRVHALELPGHGQQIGGELATDIERLIGDIAGATRPLLDRPAYFVGHSLGAVLAFETLRRLTSFPIVRLFASGCRAPSQMPSDQTRAIAALDGDAFVQQVRAFGGLPDDILRQPGLRAIFLPILKADFTLIAGYRYRPGAPLDVPITLLTGSRDRHVPDSSLTAWQKETRHAITRQHFEGGHFFILDAKADVIRHVGSTIDAPPATTAPAPPDQRAGAHAEPARGVSRHGGR
ncbi:thioesterase [Bradyrhizobium sp. U87765 SZCCT0131]|uniref:thioesterase II family protein n=1 Tax=unclassified Bradyrhizobium TaxID=2631580 RepID=UPI001BA8D918|nr:MULTISPECIES: alpha/beta fold hydrolase [unclassified Bradyrhizobium]MBR1217838.1 thioesterase [Bradyrhizobium sp. U87765 SZCCT0131]MBR1261216.1 thioesterase [Bradyrhizobium sp. U87765 SZCCT0134]MBR1303336.1 thioesterase [Bradyrhizobium sp. U87765 SZCCT0110]MBR1318942.1 thioesterase [Bradyrhizobium sp. U87765 SZCCT0109]MBR1347267.1 thioesterase [Bradyrhizobium sp. U87765 SZCCT0048]